MTTSHTKPVDPFNLFNGMPRDEKHRFRQLPQADQDRVLRAAHQLHDWVNHEFITLEEAHKIYLWIRFGMPTETFERLDCLAKYMKQDLEHIPSEFLGGLARYVSVLESGLASRDAAILRTLTDEELLEPT